MTRTLSAAVIGLGSMGANHARVLADTPGIELVAVADANPAAVAKAVAGRPIPGFPDAASLLRETHPDMVSIVVPTQLHEEVALQCIAAGANVLVEKPIAARNGRVRARRTRRRDGIRAIVSSEGGSPVLDLSRSCANKKTQ